MRSYQNIVHLGFSSSVKLFEDPSALFLQIEIKFLLFFDTGASLTITLIKEDYIEPPQPFHMPYFLGGIAHGLEFMGIGEISWTFVADYY